MLIIIFSRITRSFALSFPTPAHTHNIACHILDSALQVAAECLMLHHPYLWLRSKLNSVVYSHAIKRFLLSQPLLVIHLITKKSYHCKGYVSCSS